jgi:hypothetical protein
MNEQTPARNGPGDRRELMAKGKLRRENCREEAGNGIEEKAGCREQASESRKKVPVGNFECLKRPERICEDYTAKTREDNRDSQCV